MLLTCPGTTISCLSYYVQMAGVVDDRLMESLVTGTIIHSLDGDESASN